MGTGVADPFGYGGKYRILQRGERLYGAGALQRGGTVYGRGRAVEHPRG